MRTVEHARVLVVELTLLGERDLEVERFFAALFEGIEHLAVLRRRDEVRIDQLQVAQCI